MSNTDPIRNQVWTQVLAKGKESLILIRRPPCPVKVLAVIAEQMSSTGSLSKL